MNLRAEISRLLPDSTSANVFPASYRGGEPPILSVSRANQLLDPNASARADISSDSTRRSISRFRPVPRAASVWRVSPLSPADDTSFVVLSRTTVHHRPRGHEVSQARLDDHA